MILTSTQHSWTTSTGEEFPYSQWQAEVPAGMPPRAVLVAIHGLSGAAQDFQPLGARLAKQGITTLALELRGQGNDPQISRRGDLADLQEWLDDIRTFLALVRKLHPGLPLFYAGESMGGALVARFLAEAAPIDQPQGVIFFVPVITVSNPIPWWVEQLFRMLLWVRPQLPINLQFFVGKKSDEEYRLTRDEAHIAWYKSAKHKIHTFTLRFFKNLQNLISSGYAVAPRIRVPALVLYAEHDIFITPAQVEKFFALLGSADKECHFFPESYHLLLHDLDREKVLARIESWLLARC